jgi:hypothetical protein
MAGARFVREGPPSRRCFEEEAHSSIRGSLCRGRRKVANPRVALAARDDKTVGMLLSWRLIPPPNCFSWALIVHGCNIIAFMCLRDEVRRFFTAASGSETQLHFRGKDEEQFIMVFAPPLLRTR